MPPPSRRHTAPASTESNFSEADLACSSSSASGKAVWKPSPDLLKALDADGDGVVTKDEFDQYTRQLLQNSLTEEIKVKPSRLSRRTWLLLFASILLSTAVMGGALMHERHHVEEEVKLTNRQLRRLIRQRDRSERETRKWNRAVQVGLIAFNIFVAWRGFKVWRVRAASQHASILWPSHTQPLPPLTRRASSSSFPHLHSRPGACKRIT